VQSGRSNLKIPEIRLEPVFPVFYKYYDSNPLGAATIQNQENGPIGDVKVSLFVNQYMERPKLCGTLKELKRLQEVSVPLYSLFTDKILAVTEGTKVSAELTVEYTYMGKDLKKSQVESLRVYDRNAMTWDDDRKATSFVTARDPTVLLYARNVTSVVRERVNSKAINENFRTAVGLFESLGVYGISYVPDNKTPFTETYQNKQTIDYLQFPAQTLYYKGGDCDDLSILYAALLESVGVRTAFITIPGHIYIAFDPGMSKEEARNTFQNPDDLIFTENEVWLPVEVTEVRSGFAKAWQLGAKQWRENAARGSAALLQVREGWKVYEPVGYAIENQAVSLPPLEDVARRYQVSLEQFVKNEIAAQVKRLRELLEASPDEPSLRNKLGVVYARYGFFNDAETEFTRAISRVEYVPSILNLGNLYFLREDYPRALAFYTRAQQQSPDNPSVLLAVARVQHEMENLPAAHEAFAKLQEKDPKLASRFAYLGADAGETARAASSQLRETAVWDE
jgi:tetratricopeptide (TPR) repeat protein